MLNPLPPFILSDSTLSRRRFLRWLGLGTVTLAVGACATQPTTFSIDIRAGGFFSPSPLVIPNGATVIWINRDSQAYTVTCDPAKVTDKAHVRLPPGAPNFDSGVLYSGQQWAYTFTTPGAFLYTSVISSISSPESATGVVVVTA